MGLRLVLIGRSCPRRSGKLVDDVCLIGYEDSVNTERTQYCPIGIGKYVLVTNQTVGRLVGRGGGCRHGLGYAGDGIYETDNRGANMTLTKKQTKQLRGLANSLKPLFYVGKNDLTEAAVKQADETIEKHELIKCAVQDGSGLTAKEAAAQLAEELGADVVQTIGNRFVLYRRSQRDDVEHIRLVRQ